jgi:hypothetical protein
MITPGVAVVVGCGGGDGGADAAVVLENPGFITPGELPQAYKEVENVWELQGAPDFSCLDTATTDVPSTVDIVLTGEVTDFQTDDPVPGAEIAAFDGVDFAGTPVATGAADMDAKYSLTLPTGVSRLAFRTMHEDALDTYLMNQYYEPDQAAQSADLNTVSHLTANALPAFIGVMRTPGLGVLAGAVRDCAKNEVGGLIATVSARACAGDTACEPDHLDGAQTYYFSAGSTSLPVRLSQQANTNKDGLFVVIELPPASEAYLQVWGFTTQAELDAGTLRLIAEIPAPVLADSVITGSMEPLRTP